MIIGLAGTSLPQNQRGKIQPISSQSGFKKSPELEFCKAELFSLPHVFENNKNRYLVTLQLSQQPRLP